MSALILLVRIASVVIMFGRVCIRHALSDSLNQMFLIVFIPVFVKLTLIMACAAFAMAHAGADTVRCPVPRHSDLPYTDLMLTHSLSRGLQFSHSANQT